MLNLDAVGRFRDGGLAVLGCGTADEWRHIAMGIGFTIGVASTCIADDPGGSDQVVFHELGVPAVQLFTGAHADYHRPSDDVERIDADGLVQVASWVREALVYLAEREEPLTSKLAGAAASASAPPAPAGERRVSLGTVPAFAFAGPGVQIDSVLDGSPAAAAGVLAGDVLLAIDGEELADLRAFSEALKRHAPGDVIRILVQRGVDVRELEATLVAR
jgi:membrane-associated protease RseP (regulator of RpoE activity)